ncbi:transposase [Nocardia sp. NPDC052278]|uniref:transposase n=1 Tax=Nocardia sp. NPDC052278 TaxID=3364328 RepID=UPI0037C5122F
MAEKRRKFDAEFREGAIRIVRETGRPIAQIARELGVNEGRADDVGGAGSAAAAGERGRWRVERVRTRRAATASAGERRAGDGA